MSEAIYDVVYEDNRYELAKLVSSMMLDGWTPQGGICVVMIEAPTYERDGCFAYYQAMTRTLPKGDAP